MVSKVNTKYIVISKSLPDFLTSKRLIEADYLNVDYADIISGVYDYTSGGDNDLLIHNGGLVYPSGNSNDRNYYAKFKYNKDATLSHITFSIDHTGSETDFLTDANTGGTVDMNNIKFEFLVKRTTDLNYGYYNPFSYYNAQGVSKTSLSRNGIVTKVSITLSTGVRIGQNDLIIVRVFASSEWTNKIRNIKILDFQ